MINLTRKELEQMLSLLDLQTLDKINSKCRENNYAYSCPLSMYAPEAIVKYASAIYRYILPHFGTETVTLDQYVDKWLVPYTNLMEQLATKADGFMSRLRTIVSTPVPLAIPSEKCVYKEISAFLDDYDSETAEEWYLFEGSNDFLCNTLSPLRWSSVNDSRIPVLIAEVDALRAICNNELIAFIGYLPTIEEEVNAIKNELPAPLPKYGKELKHYRELIQERLAYYNLKPKTIAMLTAHKAQITQSDWAIISQALNDKVITTKVKRVITASLKAIRQAKQAKQTVATTKPTPINPTVVAATNDLFITTFIRQLGTAYAIPVVVPEETLTIALDNVLETLDAFYASQGTSPDAVEIQQKSTELWYSDFDNIRQYLAACLKIHLNKLSPSAVLSAEILSHGAIKGMLDYVKQIQKPNALAYDYTKLAQELHYKLRVSTDYYLDTALTELSNNACKVSSPITPIISNGFDLTPPIQGLMDGISANVVTTAVSVLLEKVSAQSLVAVNDYTIKQIALMLTGQPCTPYMLNGKLIIHIIASDRYLKVVPTARDTGYTDYRFRAYNWDTLNDHIFSIKQLLIKTPDYLEWQAENKVCEIKEYSYRLLPKQVELRKIACKEAEYFFGLLLGMAKDSYKDDEKIMSSIRKIEKSYYYRDLIISGHRLSAWVAYPTEYRDKISSKPVDAKGNCIYYEPNHIDSNPSNNAPENLKIELKQDNLDLRSTSRPVGYNGQHYLTLTKYCEATVDLSYDYLNTCLNKLQPGETFDYKNRIYSLGANEQQYIATDAEVKAPEIIFNGKTYASVADFAATDVKLVYKTISQGLYRARKDGKTEYKYKIKNKRYTFILENNGNITITL